jgi:hypothetical protein
MPHTKRAEVAISMSDKVDFKAKLVRRDKEDHSILIKETIYQEKIAIVNCSTPNVDTHNFIKKKNLLDIKA